MVNKKNIICEVKFGSTLYGTRTEDSDDDIKGIFLPTKKDILLGKISNSINMSTGDNKSKNGKDDTDTEYYSLHYFLKLACEGQTGALDMLHVNRENIIKTHPIWETLMNKRSMFYTKNLSAFIGYARRQASKYGIKGSRLKSARIVKDYLGTLNQGDRLADHWFALPRGEHIDFLHPENNIRVYQVCGRKIQETCTVAYAKDIVDRFYESYGDRAKRAENNEGIDWKAVSHAVRSAYQLREILSTKDLVFPLKDRKVITDIKEGKLHYMDEVGPLLDSLMSEVEDLVKVSDFPEKTDRGYWDIWLMNIIDKYIF